MTNNKWHIQPEAFVVSDVAAIQSEDRLLRPGIPARLIRIGKEKITRIDLIFNAGSRYQNKLFTASLTNSMLIEGTSKHTALEIAELFDFYGSYCGPGSDRDEAELTLYTLNKHLNPTITLLLELISDPLFGEQELDILLQSRIKQLTIDETRIESQARKMFAESIYGKDHPYGQVGRPDDLTKINREDLKDFFKKQYLNSDIRIMITSNEPEEAFRILQDQWENMPSAFKKGSVIKGAEIPAINMSDQKQHRLEKPGALQASLRIGRPLFSRKEPDFIGLSIAITILGGYFGSRLMKNIREEKGYSYGISANLFSYRDHGFFSIGSNVDGSKWKESIAECKKEIDLMCQHQVGDQELQLVKNFLSGDLQRRLDGPFKQADMMRSLWTHDLDFSFIQKYLQTLKDISSQEILKLSQQHLNYRDLFEIAVIP